MNWMSELNGRVGESARRRHPWFRLRARAVEQLGLVAVVGNAIVVPDPLLR